MFIKFKYYKYIFVQVKIVVINPSSEYIPNKQTLQNIICENSDDWIKKECNNKKENQFYINN